MYEIPLSSQTSLWWDLGILVLVFGLVMAAEALALRRGRRSRSMQVLLGLALAGYLAVYAWLAFFYRTPFDTAGFR